MDVKKLFWRNFLWLTFTVSVFWCLIKLSFWQYDRGFEKEQRTLRIEQLNQRSPLTLNEVVQLSNAQQFTGEEGVNDFPVTITGQFNNKIFLLDNQVEKSVLGYRVLQVVETDRYSALVNLGWVKGSIDRAILPDVSPLEGQYQFKGHVRIIEQGIMLTEQNFSQPSWPLRIQQIEINKLEALIDKPLLPFVIYVDEGQSLGYEKNWNPIVMPAEKHFAYAFQWASLALAWLILMITLRIKTYASFSQKKNNSTNELLNKLHLPARQVIDSNS